MCLDVTVEEAKVLRLTCLVTETNAREQDRHDMIHTHTHTHTPCSRRHRRTPPPSSETPVEVRGRTTVHTCLLPRCRSLASTAAFRAPVKHTNTWKIDEDDRGAPCFAQELLNSTLHTRSPFPDENTRYTQFSHTHTQRERERERGATVYLPVARLHEREFLSTDRVVSRH